MKGVIESFDDKNAVARYFDADGVEETVEHQVEGLVFESGYDYDSRTQSIITCESKWWMETIKKAIVSDFFWGPTYYALVRKGECIRGERVEYYPLPLIFATRAERVAEAARQGLEAPDEIWVEQTRQRIEETVGLLDVNTRCSALRCTGRKARDQKWSRVTTMRTAMCA